jgi:hypothetical protein
MVNPGFQFYALLKRVRDDGCLGAGVPQENSSMLSEQGSPYGSFV